jgi:hypothetical protein
MGNHAHIASSANFVYSCPSITLLAHFIVDTVKGTDNTEASTAIEAKVTKMNAMVKEFASFAPAVNTSTTNICHQSDSTGQVLFITGTTGGLGCHLLHDAYENEEVVRVYAFNRPQRSGTSLAERQRQVLRVHGLNESIVEKKKIVLLEGDLTAEKFGLSERAYKEVSNFFFYAHTLLNSIIHCCSWPSLSRISSTTVYYHFSSLCYQSLILS